MVNKVILIGNLGADPELKYTESEIAVCNLRVATTYQQKGGEKQTEWHRVTAWSRQAENCKEYLSTGSKVYVEGRLQTRKWKDKDGNDRYTTEVVAFTVQFLDSKGQTQQRDEPPDEFPEDDIPF